MKKIYFLVMILSAVLFNACKKDSKSNNNGNTSTTTTTTTTPSTLDLIRDSVFLYAAEDNLWYSSLPTFTAFNPRAITGTSDINALTTELDKISQYAINPNTNKPYEYYAPSPGEAKYSFIDDGTVSAELNGVKGDFGFDVQYNQVNDLRVEYVYPGSPAGIAGIKRGYSITSINSRTAISYDGTGYGTGTGVNLSFVSNAIYRSSTITMTLKNNSGGTVSVNLTTASYNVKPVLLDSVYTLANGHKLGYIVFNSFTSQANAGPLLTAAFADFTAKGVTDLAVDLRYNGGGYVSTAELLDNLIVPTAKNKTLMYNTFYNYNLINGNDPLLAKQWRKDPSSGQSYNYAQFDYSVSGNAVNFSKIGTLNVNRVFFIVTGQTASASELTINNLRPEMDVQFIGEQSYGKPVGFFDININKYTMYTPEFSTKNSVGQGDYYSGFLPGGTGYPGVADNDDITHDFGDTNETLLAHIVNFVNKGTYAVSTPVIQSLNGRSGNNFTLQDKANMANYKNKFKFTGMIHDKKLPMKAK